MTRIAPDEIMRCAEFKEGASSRGPWELIQVLDEKGRNPVTIFVNNVPCHGAAGKDFIIRKITEVKVGNRKDNTGAWRQSTTITADVEFIKSDINVDSEDNSDLPDGWDDLNLDLDIGLPL